jgi:hypothetical protein
LAPPPTDATSIDCSSQTIGVPPTMHHLQSRPSRTEQVISQMLWKIKTNENKVDTLTCTYRSRCRCRHHYATCWNRR